MVLLLFILCSVSLCLRGGWFVFTPEARRHRESGDPAGRRGETEREWAGAFGSMNVFIAEPADRANDEERGQVAVSIERRGHAPRHGSSWSRP